MSEQISDYYSIAEEMYRKERRKRKKTHPLWNLLLFLVTVVTTTFAGMFFIASDFDFSIINLSLQYSGAILFILGVHEFGHYFAARYHKVDTTLPFFIPLPIFPGLIHFGTMGAVIRTRTPVSSNKAMFDIGIAGPIAGFIASLMILIWGYTHLPGVEYLLRIHPDYFSPYYGDAYLSLEFGDSLLNGALRYLFTGPADFVPPMSEIYHYPFLCAGWFGLFVTSMNMIPVGQLDGGHVIYSMFGGKIHKTVAGIMMLTLIVIGGAGLIDVLFEFNSGYGWTGWLFWALVLFFVLKMHHPPVAYFTDVGKVRRVLGWVSIGILIVSFSPTPFLIY